MRKVIEKKIAPVEQKIPTAIHSLLGSFTSYIRVIKNENKSMNVKEIKTRRLFFSNVFFPNICHPPCLCCSPILIF